MIQFRTVDLDEVQIHYAEAPGPDRPWSFFTELPARMPVFCR